MEERWECEKGKWFNNKISILEKEKEKKEKVVSFLHHFQIKERKRRHPNIKNTNIY